MSDRMPKVDELVHHQLAQIIREELDFPVGTIVTVQRVAVSADLSQAKVYISVLPEGEQGTALRLLIKAAGHLRQLLSERVALHHTPKLRFFVDDSTAQALELEKLLDELKKDED